MQNVRILYAFFWRQCAWHFGLRIRDFGSASLELHKADLWSPEKWQGNGRILAGFSLYETEFRSDLRTSKGREGSKENMKEHRVPSLTRALPSALGLAARTFVRSFRFVPNE